MNTLKRLGKQKPEEMQKWLVKNMDKLMVHKDIVGMVEVGLHSDEKTRAQVAKLQESLAPNYLVVEEYKKPSMSSGVGSLFAGIILGIVSIFYWVGYIARWQKRLA